MGKDEAVHEKDDTAHADQDRPADHLNNGRATRVQKSRRGVPAAAPAPWPRGADSNASTSRAHGTPTPPVRHPAPAHPPLPAVAAHARARARGLSSTVQSTPLWLRLRTAGPRRPECGRASARVPRRRRRRQMASHAGARVPRVCACVPLCARPAPRCRMFHGVAVAPAKMQGARVGACRGLVPENMFVPIIFGSCS